MKKITQKSLVIGIIAALLVLSDSLITNLLNLDASFTWVAFVSWTVFFGATIKERFKAIVGYVIGFLAAVAIIKLGAIFSIIGVLLGSMLATFIINFLCIELENIEKIFPISISAIFVGIAMTFSGVGIGLGIDTLSNSLLLLTIIVLYGILGLISGFLTLKFSK